jgi:hypothetical protein
MRHLNNEAREAQIRAWAEGRAPIPPVLSLEDAEAIDRIIDEDAALREGDQ